MKMLFVLVMFLLGSADCQRDCREDGKRKQQVENFFHESFIFTELCLPQDECTSFQAEKEKLNKLDRSSPERAELLKTLQEMVCNSQEKRVCCKDEGKIRFVTPYLLFLHSELK